MGCHSHCPTSGGIKELKGMQNTEHWFQPRKITHWSYALLMYKLIREGKDVAAFMLDKSWLLMEIINIHCRPLWGEQSRYLRQSSHVVQNIDSSQVMCRLWQLTEWPGSAIDWKGHWWRWVEMICIMQRKDTDAWVRTFTVTEWLMWEEIGTMMLDADSMEELHLCTSVSFLETLLTYYGACQWSNCCCYCCGFSSLPAWSLSASFDDHSVFFEESSFRLCSTVEKRLNQTFVPWFTVQ